MEPRRVICVSRALGAGGERVGRIVSAELGFGYVDEEIVTRAAQRIDIPRDLVAGVEERTPLLRRLLGEVAGDVAHVSMMSGVAPPREVGAGSDDYRDLIQQAIQETANEGDVLIVAHAASMALAGQPGVLRILVTGSRENREQRLIAETGAGEAEAGKLVHDGDLARADYLKRFYGVKEELPTHYDLVVNTDALSADDAATIVLAACRP
jgi:hypothetical protein